MSSSNVFWILDVGMIEGGESSRQRRLIEAEALQGPTESGKSTAKMVPEAGGMAWHGLMCFLKTLARR